MAGTKRAAPVKAFDPVRGNPPALKYCAVSSLQIDPAYQRGMENRKSAQLVEEIAREWNWDLCQVLAVADRGEEGRFVIDGQHRLAAARLRGDIDLLPCLIGTYSNRAAEAAGFVALNSKRTPLRKLDLFRAAVAAGDEQALDIAKAVEAAGLALAPHETAKAWKPGWVAHVGGIEREWRQNKAAAKLALIALGKGFDGQILNYCGTIYRGLAAACREELQRRGAFEPERFARFTAMLRQRTQLGWIREIQQFFKNGDVLFYNQAIEGCFIEAWRRAQAPATPAVPQRPIDPVPPFRDEKRDWQFCSQCDARRTEAQIAACGSRFCPFAKGV